MTRTAGASQIDFAGTALPIFTLRPRSPLSTDFCNRNPLSPAKFIPFLYIPHRRSSAAALVHTGTDATRCEERPVRCHPSTFCAHPRRGTTHACSRCDAPQLIPSRPSDIGISSVAASVGNENRALREGSLPRLDSVAQSFHVPTSTLTSSRSYKGLPRHLLRVVYPVP